MENVFNIVSLLGGIIIINVDIKVTMWLEMLYIVLCRMSRTFKTMRSTNTILMQKLLLVIGVLVSSHQHQFALFEAYRVL